MHLPMLLKKLLMLGCAKLKSRLKVLGLVEKQLFVLSLIPDSR
jgi:hypothetical protein